MPALIDTLLREPFTTSVLLIATEYGTRLVIEESALGHWTGATVLSEPATVVLEPLAPEAQILSAVEAIDNLIAESRATHSRTISRLQAQRADLLALAPPPEPEVPFGIAVSPFDL